MLYLTNAAIVGESAHKREERDEKVCFLSVFFYRFSPQNLKYKKNPVEKERRGKTNWTSSNIECYAHPSSERVQINKRKVFLYFFLHPSKKSGEFLTRIVVETSEKKRENAFANSHRRTFCFLSFKHPQYTNTVLCFDKNKPHSPKPIIWNDINVSMSSCVHVLITFLPIFFLSLLMTR